MIICHSWQTYSKGKVLQWRVSNKNISLTQFNGTCFKGISLLRFYIFLFLMISWCNTCDRQQCSYSVRSRSNLVTLLCIPVLGGKNAGIYFNILFPYKNRTQHCAW